VNIATVFIILLIGGLIGVVVCSGTEWAESQPTMNTICNDYYSKTKIVDSYINGEKVPMEITEYVCTDWEMGR
jgi:hypothetical protein